MKLGHARVRELCPNCGAGIVLFVNDVLKCTGTCGVTFILEGGPHKKLYETDLVAESPTELEQRVLAEPYAAAVLLKNTATQLQGLQFTLKDVLRKRSNNIEWWKTYRAALTGAIGFYDCVEEKEYLESAHRRAKALAELAHGPLQELPEEQ